MTRSDLQTRILDALNESSTSPVFWSAEQIQNVIHDGMEILSEEAEAILRTAVTVLRPGATYYATRGISSDMMAPLRLWMPNQNRRLVAVTLSQLDAYHEKWPTVTGTPEYWFPMGWDWFGLWPTVSTGGGILRVDYLAWPRSLMDDSDTPEFQDGDQDGLVLYGIYEGLLKRWDFAQAMIMLGQFLERAGLAKDGNGPGRMQARQWQRNAQPSGAGFKSGMGSYSA